MLKRIEKLLASPMLTIGLLFYSVFLIFFATLAQIDVGVERAASEYFESFFAVYKIGVVPIPLLGGAFVGTLAFVNIFFSVLRYLNFGASGLGNSIIHCALALMLLAGALQYFMRQEGRVSIRKGETSNVIFVQSNGATKTEFLPFSVRLLDFKKEMWQGSDIPKSFSSKIVFLRGNSNVEALVEMNSPASFGGWTFFQSSYAEDGKVSIFTVVKNPARMLPWFASGAVFVGMLITIFSRNRRQK